MSDWVPIPYKVRDRHIFVPGMTGHGKSTLFHAMAYQDIKNGAGVCVIDPKGDLVKQLVHWVPEDRKDDCFYLDLEHPIPLDLMSYANDDAKETLVGDLKYILTKGMSTEHAPLMNDLIETLIYTLFDANDNPAIPDELRCTFIDIHDFLELKSRREQILKYVRNQRYRQKWEDYLPTPKERQSLISRIRPFVNSPSLSKILGTPTNTLNIPNLMNNRKILLIDIGGVSESKKIYGALLVSLIQQGAFARHNIPKHKRVPFFLYVDEFENFQTSSFAAIISQARGYRLCLTVGCQWLSQLASDIKDALFTVSSYIIFAVSPKDSREFKDLILPRYTPQNLVSLPPYRALYLIDKRNPRIDDTPKPPPHTSTVGKVSYAEYIRKRTVDSYPCNAPAVCFDKGDDKPEPESGKAPSAQSTKA